MSKRETSEAFVAIGFFTIVILMGVLAITYLRWNRSRSTTDQTPTVETVPTATLVGVSGTGDGIYEFVDIKTNQRCLLYRTSIVFIPEKK